MPWRNARTKSAFGMALGAQTGDVFVIVVKQGLRLVSQGIVIGLIGAFAVTRLLSQMLFGITAFDPITYALVDGFTARHRAGGLPCPGTAGDES